MIRHCDSIEFNFPLDGLMLTDAAGEKTEKGLKIIAYVDAPSGKKFTLNGIPMEMKMHDMYSAEVLLDSYKNTLELVEEGGYRQSIDVYYLKKGCRKYRYSLDDNIWFLQNLTENKDVYKSAFEDPYLAMLKDIHDRYGSKFHINVYWETPRHGGFNLTQMTDKFRSEFIANSDWMRMSFHANADVPGRPYVHATYDQVKFEAGRINDQIIRFAGEETFSKSVCTVHFGDISYEGAKALRDLGYRALVSTYSYGTLKGYDIRAYCDAETCFLLQKYGFWYDKDLDICHFRYNGGIQHADPKNFPAILEGNEKAAPMYLFKDICLHEQYFYPDYARHQPNYPEKLDTTCRWLDEHGYEPILMDELFEFNTHKN